MRIDPNEIISTSDDSSVGQSSSGPSSPSTPTTPPAKTKKRVFFADDIATTTLYELGSPSDDKPEQSELEPPSALKKAPAEKGRDKTSVGERGKLKIFNIAINEAIEALAKHGSLNDEFFINNILTRELKIEWSDEAKEEFKTQVQEQLAKRNSKIANSIPQDVLDDASFSIEKLLFSDQNTLLDPLEEKPHSPGNDRIKNTNNTLTESELRTDLTSDDLTQDKPQETASPETSSSRELPSREVNAKSPINEYPITLATYSQDIQNFPFNKTVYKILNNTTAGELKDKVRASLPNISSENRYEISLIVTWLNNKNFTNITDFNAEKNLIVQAYEECKDDLKFCTKTNSTRDTSVRATPEQKAERLLHAKYAEIKARNEPSLEAHFDKILAELNYRKQLYEIKEEDFAFQLNNTVANPSPETSPNLYSAQKKLVATNAMIEYVKALQNPNQLLPSTPFPASAAATDGELGKIRNTILKVITSTNLEIPPKEEKTPSFKQTALLYMKIISVLNEYDKTKIVGPDSFFSKRSDESKKACAALRSLVTTKTNFSATSVADALSHIVFTKKTTFIDCLTKHAITEDWIKHHKTTQPSNEKSLANPGQ